MSCIVAYCQVRSCHVQYCQVWSCLVMSCPVLSCPAPSCHVMSWPPMSCPVDTLTTCTPSLINAEKPTECTYEACRDHINALTAITCNARWGLLQEAHEGFRDQGRARRVSGHGARDHRAGIIEQGPTWIAICIDSACRLLYVCRTACGRAFIWTLLAAWLPWRCALRTGMALCYVGCFDVVLS
jgi:hypothetical protein